MSHCLFQERFYQVFFWIILGVLLRTLLVTEYLLITGYSKSDIHVLSEHGASCVCILKAKGTRLRSRYGNSLFCELVVKL